jgi:hypothetical protein
MHEQERATTLPGVLATISAGFDLTARHLWLIVLPVVLDLFYWLGPQLRFQKLIERLFQNLNEQLLEMQPAEAEVLELGAQLVDAAPQATQTNLFTTLTVQLIGVPALMVGLVPETTPLTTQVFEVNNWSTWLGMFLIFSLMGLLLTALFYTLVAVAISKQTPEMNQLNAVQWGNRILSSWLRLIGLALIFLFIVMILYIPLSFIGTILLLINNTLGLIALLVGLFIIIWVIIALSMAPYGIVLNGRPLLRAIVESVRLVQAYLPFVIYLLVTVLLIGAILDWLLFTVENGTWLTLVNIVGHAFVSTALVAAVFIFYRDRYTVMFDPDAVYEIQSLQDSNS